ncbi:MAG: hypothetical protein JO101_08395 [Candidatus Eremiobacteraeota bacterium]|nr:hypothetical protein [Candidatus Eremiobacteraeota bacterium]
MIDAGLDIGTTQTLIDHVRHAQDVRLKAYLLRNPHLIAALEEAGDRGAHVEVRLCGDPVEPKPDAHLKERNQHTIDELRKHHVDAQPDDTTGPGALHVKVAKVDGRTFYDDRNWCTAADETVIVDERAGDPRIAHTKRAALAKEADLIRTAPGREVFVSTEALGPGPVADAIEWRAARGDSVKLLYDPAEIVDGDALFARLRSAGVEVRACHQARKIAAAPGRAWLGSANASPGGATREEWGLVVHNGPFRLADKLLATLRNAWRAAA